MLQIYSKTIGFNKHVLNSVQLNQCKFKSMVITFFESKHRRLQDIKCNKHQNHEKIYHS